MAQKPVFSLQEKWQQDENRRARNSDRGRAPERYRNQDAET